MNKDQKSKGNCIFCHQSFDKAGMSQHLESCTKRKLIITEINKKSDDKIKLFHLLVQDVYQGNFWLHLEMSGEAKLIELDKYLRAIWLECCGHLSHFSYKKWGQKISMNSTANRVFEPGLQIYHIYDYGTSSETKIKIIAEREGIFHYQKPIFLMARNDPPEYQCQECGKEANWLCIECVYNNDDGTLCDKHAESHPHKDYGGLFEIVNSPRLGMCGYTGPAEPPY